MGSSHAEIISGGFGLYSKDGLSSTRVDTRLEKVYRTTAPMKAQVD